MPLIGDVLAGRYRIEAVLGAGGMASVYRATDLRLDRLVAVKVLAPNLAAEPSMADRFEREAQAMAGAAHPNVVAVFDVEAGDPETGREPFYVMDLCEGGSLAERISAAGRIPPADLIGTIARTADGLAELHRRGLIHRDVKPSNILFVGEVPKLADFGLVRNEAPGDATAMTAAGTMLGTLHYLAPELLTGSPPSPSSDVYALGVTAFEGLTGQLPHPPGTLSEVVEWRSLPARIVSSVAPDLGISFDAPIARALAVDPSARPAPAEFAGQLTAGLANPPGLAAAVSASSQINPDVASPPWVDPLADTQISLPVSSIAATAVPPRSRTPAPAAAQTADSGESQAGSRRFPGPAFIALLGVALAIAVIATLGRGIGIVDSSGPPGSSTPATSAGPMSPSVTASPVTPALAALDAVVAAIEAAKGGPDGLTGRDANDLLATVGGVRDALARGDVRAARTAAEDLSRQVKSLAKDLSPDRAKNLRDAVSALLAAIPAG
ncbi:MAG: protein kinase [Candidatus Limnocylindrales bacterium]